MTREEFYKLTDILNSEVLGNFMHGGEADELIAMFEEAVEHSNILEQEEPVSDDFTKALAECIHKAQCSVVDPLAHAEVWKEELVKLAKCEEPVNEDFKSFEQQYMKDNEDEILCVYDRHAGLVDGAQWQKEQMKHYYQKSCLALCTVEKLTKWWRSWMKY